jgi:hypothetical protein
MKELGHDDSRSGAPRPRLKLAAIRIMVVAAVLAAILTREAVAAHDLKTRWTIASVAGAVVAGGVVALLVLRAKNQQRL